MPERIQLRRTRGWRKPEGAVVVARPSKWGNPFTIAGALEAEMAADEAEARAFVAHCYADWLAKGEGSEWWSTGNRERWEWQQAHLPDLVGKDLACWCPLVGDDGKRVPCHADVLLEVANG